MDNMAINEKDLKKIEPQDENKNSENYMIKSENIVRKKKIKSYTIIPHKINFNLNSKYDNALIEELFNSKEKSWRNDIINASPEKDNNNLKRPLSNKNLIFDNTFQNLENNNDEVNNEEQR